MSRRVALSVVIGVFVLAAAACGGEESSDAGPTVSAETAGLIRDASAICSEVNERQADANDQLDRADSPEERAAAFRELGAVVDEQLTELQALAPTPELGELWDQWLALQVRFRDLWGEIAQLTEAGDQDAVDARLDDFLDQNREEADGLTAQLEDLGFDECVDESAG